MPLKIVLTETGPRYYTTVVSNGRDCSCERYGGRHALGG